jgi:undecaprenyl-diphosphatase
MNLPTPRTRWIVAVAAGAFGLLAVVATVAEPILLRFDLPVQAFILENRTVELNRAMVWLTFLGTRWAIGAATLVLFVWSQVTKRHRLLVFVIVGAVLMNPVFEIACKELVGRVRPAVAQLLPGNGPSFPSGHVLASVGFYGLLPLVTWEMTRATWVRAASVAGSLAVIAVVTVSRPYLDVHWTTDAIAGVLLGTVLVAGTYAAYQWVAAAAPRAADARRVVGSG